MMCTTLLPFMCWMMLNVKCFDVVKMDPLHQHYLHHKTTMFHFKLPLVVICLLHICISIAVFQDFYCIKIKNLGAILLFTCMLPLSNIFSPLGLAILLMDRTNKCSVRVRIPLMAKFICTLYIIMK